MAKSDMSQMLGLMIIVIIALALTPTIQTSVTDAKWAAYTETDVVTPGTLNTTALDHACRNGSASYFVVTLNQTGSNGHTIEVYITDFKDTAAQVITFYNLNNSYVGQKYSIEMTYRWYSMSAASIALVDIIPLLWVTMIIAATVVFIVYKLKFSKR